MVVGVNDLGEPLGETIKCSICGESHKVEHLYSISYYTCGDNSYVCGIDRRSFNETTKPEVKDE